MIRGRVYLKMLLLPLIIVLYMSKQPQAAKSTATPVVAAKKSIKELFDERNRTRPESREEENAAEKILEAIFPDSNAD
jgi:ABC-type transporter MlaC component